MQSIKYRIHKEVRCCRCREGNINDLQDPMQKSVDKNIMNIKIAGATKEQMNWIEKQFETIIKTVGCASDEVLRWK